MSFHGQKNYKKLANFVMELPQYLYDEYEEDINSVFLFFDEFQIIKEFGEELTDFLWYTGSYIQIVITRVIVYLPHS